MKKKLALNELMVNSFVTELSKNNEHTIKWGSTTVCSFVSGVVLVAASVIIVAGGVAAGVTAAMILAESKNESK